MFIIESVDEHMQLFNMVSKKEPCPFETLRRAMIVQISEVATDV
jgi:hypothetical protein